MDRRHRTMGASGMVKESHPLLDRLPPAHPSSVHSGLHKWVVLVSAVMAAGVLAVAVLPVFNLLLAFFDADEDWRNRILIVWATTWLLPWPGRPSLPRRLALSSIAALLVPVIVLLSLFGGWFDVLVDLSCRPGRATRFHGGKNPDAAPLSTPANRHRSAPKSPSGCGREGSRALALATLVLCACCPGRCDPHRGSGRRACPGGRVACARGHGDTLAGGGTAHSSVAAGGPHFCALSLPCRSVGFSSDGPPTIRLVSTPVLALPTTSSWGRSRPKPWTI
jgi:hypothetical protein